MVRNTHYVQFDMRICSQGCTKCQLIAQKNKHLFSDYVLVQFEANQVN
jgi:hypothetical protein